MNRKPVSCPKCRAQTILSEGKPWCPQCGWNREVAFRHVQQTLRTYRNVIIAGPLFVCAGGWWLGFPGTWLLTGAGFLGLFALLSFLTVRSELKKFQVPAAPGGIRAKPSSPSSEPAVPSRRPVGENSEPLEITGSTIYYQGQEIPVGWPRKVRLSRKTKAWYGLIFAVILYLEGVLIYLTYQRWERFRPGAEFPWGILILLVLAAFVALCGWLLPRRLRKHRYLLTTGEMALGRVVSQRIAQSSDHTEHRIGYRFKNQGGRIFDGEDRDQTENFYEGMVIPVVYERGNPANHLALCSTDYEVLPAFESANRA